MEVIMNNIDDLRALCMKFHVGKLFVFGSVLSHSFKQDSDIDFLVSFQKIKLEDYADNYFDFKFSLEDLFNREIDLLKNKPLKIPS
jgi:uncharacterized protein